MESPASNDLSILERVGRREKEAFAECLNRYGNLIWKLAKKGTNSQLEAETAVSEIFDEIWHYSVKFDSAKDCEEKFIHLIALRYLLKKFRTNKILNRMFNPPSSTILQEIIL